MPTAFTAQNMNFTIGQVLLNLSLSFALAYLAATVYRHTHAGPSSTQSFLVTLLVTPVVVCMIMMAIGSNVALSLGLVGALSIIRFRTVIKDTRDMSFLFLTIGIGLCCGSGGYALGVFGTLFVCTMLWILHKVSHARFHNSEYILVFRQNGDADAGRTIDELAPWRKLHAVTDLGEDEGCEYTYRVRLGPTVSPEKFIQRLRSVKGLSASSLISPESQLAL